MKLRPGRVGGSGNAPAFSAPGRPRLDSRPRDPARRLRGQSAEWGRRGRGAPGAGVGPGSGRGRAAGGAGGAGAGAAGAAGGRVGRAGGGRRGARVGFVAGKPDSGNLFSPLPDRGVNDFPHRG